jgi:3-oxoacyl-[acyl-carrier protein] reductase
VLQHRDSALATERTNALAARIICDGGKALPICANLSEDAGLRTLAEAAGSLGPRVHALVHIAPPSPSRGRGEPLLRADHALSLTQLRAAMHDEDTLSLLAAADVLMPMMGEGSAIVGLIASSARAGGELGAGAAAVSSGATLSLVRTLARELGPRGIRVNALLCDALLDSSTFEPSADVYELAHDSAEATAVAGTTAFMLSTDAQYVTGTDVHVATGRSTASGRRQQSE